MTEYRALGTAIYFSSATDIALTATLTGTGTATINASDSAYLTIPSGSYWRLPDLCNYVCYKVRAWLFAAITADGGVTKSSFAATDFTVKMDFAPSLTLNGSRITFSIQYTGGAHLKIGGTNCTLTAVSLTNTNGLWTKFGLVNESTTTLAGTMTTNTATFTGDAQPRSIFVFLRSEIDDGEDESAVLYKTLQTASGSISVFESGRHVAKRQLRLVDLDEDTAGRPVAVGRLGDSGLSVDRVTLNMNFIDSSFSTSGNNTIQSLYQLQNEATIGAYVLIPGVWIGRLSDQDSISLIMYDKVPASITPPTNCTLYQISEVHALWFEAIRTGYLFVYDIVETPGSAFGSILWTGGDYAIADDGTTWAPERRDIGAALYSYTFKLIRRDAPGITETSN